MPKVAYRQIRSRGVFLDQRAFRREVERTIDSKSKPELIAKHDEVVADWETRIDFRARKFVTRQGISVNVFPAGENKMIWVYVVGGTRRHKIPKVPKPLGTALRFKWDGPGSYAPKTTPAPSFGGPGRASGPIRFFRQVDHPGTKPRPFPTKIAREYKTTFSNDIENAMRRGLRRARGR